ncbi:uncharacterized [Tachysurus ichikawai]
MHSKLLHHGVRRVSTLGIITRTALMHNSIRSNERCIRRADAAVYCAELETKAKLLLVNSRFTLEVCDTLRLLHRAAEFTILSPPKVSTHFHRL